MTVRPTRIVVALPATLEPEVVYYVRRADQAGYDVTITDGNGSPVVVQLVLVKGDPGGQDTVDACVAAAVAAQSAQEQSAARLGEVLAAADAAAQARDRAVVAQLSAGDDAATSSQAAAVTATRATAAANSATAAAGSATATAADRVQTGLDRTATGTSATAAAGSATAAAASATATAADRVQTGLDRTATGTSATAAAGSATAAAASAAATAADRVQTGLDRTATGTSATAAAGSATAAATSATAAAGSSTSASTSATAAANSATAAAGSATSSANSATAAANSATAAASSAASLYSTSTTSLAVGLGSKTFVTQVSKSYSVGQWVIAASAATPGNFMIGQVTAYASTSLTLNVTVTGGTGTAADWNLAVTGQPSTIAGPQSVGGITVAPAYANPGGQGDRTALITITSSGTLSSVLTSAIYNEGSSASLINGVTTLGGPGSCTFKAGITDALVTFDFGPGAARVITELTITQHAAIANGTWQLRGSNDAATWANVGATWTLSAVTNTITAPSANQTGYRYYQLQQVGGTTTNTVYITEVTFKIGSTLLDGVAVPPPGGVAGQVPAKASAVSGDIKWADQAGDNYAGLPLSGMIAQWRFEETSGNTCADNVGSYPIDLTLPTNPNVSRTGRGLKLSNGLVQTPTMPSLKTIAMVYRCTRDQLGAFILSYSTGAGLAINGANPWAYYVGGGWGVHPLAMGSGGGSTYEVNRGGYIVLFAESPSAGTYPYVAFGGAGGGTSGRCSEMELMWAAAWNRSLTDTERSSIYSVLRKVGRARGVYLNVEDCPQKVDLVLLKGESTAEGLSLISGLSAADQALRFSDTFIQPGGCVSGSSSWTNFGSTHQLELGLNQQRLTPATTFGFEYGIAFQHRLNQLTRTRELHICKGARGSTRYGPGAGQSSWAPSGDLGNLFNCYFWSLRQLYDVEQNLRLAGKGARFAGIVELTGLNDALSTSYAPDSATVQAYMQASYDRFQLDTGLPTPKMVLVKCHNRDPSSNATALAAVRAGQAAFVAANANTVLYDADALTLNADNVHFDATGSKTGGAACYTLLGI